MLRWLGHCKSCTLLLPPVPSPTLTCSQLTCEDGHGSCLAGSIMSQESSDLSLVHVETELIHGHLALLLLILEQAGQKGLKRRKIQIAYILPKSVRISLLASITLAI